MQNMESFVKVLRFLIDENGDSVQLNFKKMLGIFFYEQILEANPTYTHNCRKKRCIKEYIVYRQNYNDVANLSHLQVLLRVHFRNTKLNSFHGQAGKHPGISKTMQITRQNCISPSIEIHVRKRAPNLRSRQTQWQTTKKHLYTCKDFRYRRRSANRPATGTLNKWRLWNYHHSN